MEMIKTRAAVSWGANQPLSVTEVDLMPPQKRRSAGPHRRQRRLPHRSLHLVRQRSGVGVPGYLCVMKAVA